MGLRDGVRDGIGEPEGRVKQVGLVTGCLCLWWKSPGLIQGDPSEVTFMGHVQPGREPSGQHFMGSLGTCDSLEAELWTQILTNLNLGHPVFQNRACVWFGVWTSGPMVVNRLGEHGVFRRAHCAHPCEQSLESSSQPSLFLFHLNLSILWFSPKGSAIAKPSREN